MKRSVFVVSVLVIAGLVVPAQSPTGRAMAQAAAPSVETHEAHHPAAATAPAAAEALDSQSMAMHQQMMGDRKVTDAKLGPLVAQMDAATGEAKVAAMAAVIAVLVQERAAMQGKSMQMDAHTMAQMTAAGMSPEMMAAMSDCPMMKMIQGTGSAK